jgi:hypothetical protein
MARPKPGIKEALATAAHNSARQFSVFASCHKCARVHETGISITMEDGPVDKQSVGDFLPWQKFSQKPRQSFQHYSHVPSDGKAVYPERHEANILGADLRIASGSNSSGESLETFLA